MVRFRRCKVLFNRRYRETLMFIRAVSQATRPVLAHLVVTRRCNLACGYCNEFDKHSEPVPAELLRARIDRLADLGTFIVHLSGGERCSIRMSAKSWRTFGAGRCRPGCSRMDCCLVLE
ncbi:MAG TPA: radical SAM protein [Acidobacteriota bacterium]|nr:radical SAM protein [Acidobacteriota bacterium]